MAKVNYLWMLTDKASSRAEATSYNELYYFYNIELHANNRLAFVTRNLYGFSYIA